MYKTTRIITSLLLIAVTVLTLPLAALATTTYSGSYNGNSFFAYVGGSTSSISSTFNVSTAAKLKANTTVYIFYVHNGDSSEWGHVDMNEISLGNTTTITNSYSFLGCKTRYSNLGIPDSGYFDHCFYYDYINGHVVLNGVMESFSF